MHITICSPCRTTGLERWCKRIPAKVCTKHTKRISFKIPCAYKAGCSDTFNPKMTQHKEEKEKARRCKLHKQFMNDEIGGYKLLGFQRCLIFALER